MPVERVWVGLAFPCLAKSEQGGAKWAVAGQTEIEARESEAGAGGGGLPKKETQMWFWRAVSIVCVPLGPEMKGKETADARGTRVGRFGVPLFGEIRARRARISDFEQTKKR